MLSQLAICILPREGPREAAAFGVTALLPGGDFGGEQCAVPPGSGFARKPLSCFVRFAIDILNSMH
jgi:hypothetical protein